MLRRHSASPQTAFICDSVTDLPTGSVGETLRSSVLKGQQIRAFLSKKKKRSRGKAKGGRRRGDRAARGRTRCHTEVTVKLHKRRTSFCSRFRRQKRSPHAVASSQSVALGRVVFPKRCRRSAALFLPVVSRSLQEKHCSV